MKSRFYQQHVVTYLTAWTKLSDACTFRPMDQQLAIINSARDSVGMGRKNRGGEKEPFTDDERAMIAACDEHLCARMGDNGKAVDPTTRDNRPIEIGEHEAQSLDDLLTSWFSDKRP